MQQHWRKATEPAPLYAAYRSRALFVIFPSFVCRKTFFSAKTFTMNQYA